MQLDRRWLGSFFAALALGGCGGDEAPSAPAPVTYTLTDGTEVAVSSAGALRLSLDGHATLATAEGVLPRALAFEEFESSLFGMFAFSRGDETRRGFDRFTGSEQPEDDVVLRFTGSGGTTGALRIGVEVPGEVLRLTLSVTGAEDVASLGLPIACDEESTFYGWGEQYNAADQRGEAFDLFVSEQGLGRTGSPSVPTPSGHAHSTYFPMPYFLDARGFGALAETGRRATVDLCKSDPAVAWLEVVSGAPLELLVFQGPAPLDVIRQLGDRVGRPAPPPSWAYELWIGSQGGRDAVLAEADALEAAGIPARVLWVQDWTGIRMNFDGGFGVEYRWVADDELYPDLAGLIDDLHLRGYKFLSYANPFVMPGLDHFAEMEAGKMLIADASGATYLHASPAGDASHPDLTNPAARAYVKAKLGAMVSDLGMDGWMADFGEWLPLDAVLSDGSDPIAAHNHYPTEWHRLSREVMDELRPDGDWVVFSRSGFTGEQAVAQVVWAGDQEADFRAGDGLPTVIPALLNLGLSGVPFVTHDIAGFSGGPSTKELFMRWTELGAFTPIMRTHEGNDKVNNWSWEKDAATTAHFRRFAQIHALLGPEIEALAAVAASSGAPIVRHSMLHYPGDAASRVADDQFLLGPDLLVAPVVTEGATSREVYLPPGETWFHVWSGEPYEGGSRVDVPAPIGQPPVFARGADRSDLRSVP